MAAPFDALLKDFAAPGSAFRGKPFWAWNGKLEPEELRRQVRVLGRMGLGGGFMHSRVGLDTAYLSEDWFECVNAVVDECKRLGMEAWLYDEDRWPSGAAGGLVTRDPRFRMRSLVMRVLPSPRDFKWGKNVLAVFTARVEGNRASAVERVRKDGRPQPRGGRSLLVFEVAVDATSSWYNDCTYLDTMSHAAVKEFLRITHEAYRRECGSEFGKTVPGIFTDEPNYGGLFQACGPKGRDVKAPWTGRLPQVFSKRYGYDLLARLPEVFLDVTEAGPEVAGVRASQARYHYLDCITHLFVDAFSRQVGEWCDRHGLEHTGHVLAEETLRSQTSVVGSCMRFYEYMQAPGMDILTERRREYDTAKQVSSAARQFGRKWRLTETYGCTGWDFPFAGHKAIGDWQLALGINLRCQHLSWYTMEGQAKRDYPAGIFYQSPWWQAYSKVEDYFARVHAVMTRGEEVRDILVIHPVESMWLLARKGWGDNPAAARLERDLIRVRDALLAANLDFDYGDEDILSRHGKVDDGAQPGLRVARARYRAVVVPPMLTMRSSTAKLLEKFREAGGTVVFAGPAPGLVDALPADGARRLARDCARARAQADALAAALAPIGRRVSIADAGGREIEPALYLLREDRQAYYLFICNTGHHRLHPKTGDVMVRERDAAFPEVRTRVFVSTRGEPVELDPETGTSRRTLCKRLADGWQITTSLPALGSRLFLLPKERCRLPATPVAAKARSRRLGRLAGSWEIALSECNNLVLDRPAYRIGSGRWQAPEEILRLDHKVRDILGVPRRGGRMVQPWARERNPRPRVAPVELRYTFDVKQVPSGDLFLALEKPRTFEIRLNGQVVDTECEAGWWCDRSLRRVPLDAALLRPGGNLLELSCDYSEEHPGLEIVYLLGNFGTRLKGANATVVDAPTRLSLGDWCRQGLTFYSGNVTYRRRVRLRPRRGERVSVRVAGYRGVAVRVLVDGKVAGIAAWPPYEVDVTDLLPAAGKDCILGIEILGHRRNSHGPLHLAQKWPEWHGPGQFAGSGKEWRDSYNLVPCGLMAPVELIAVSG